MFTFVLGFCLFAVAVFLFGGLFGFDLVCPIVIWLLLFMVYRIYVVFVSLDWFAGVLFVCFGVLVCCLACWLVCVL